MSVASDPIVHIGFHKTGSSWLQRELLPKVRGASVVPRRIVRESLLVPTARAFDAKGVRARLFESQDGRVIVSEEELSGNLHTGGLHGAFSDEIAARLHAVAPEARIVVFLRSQPAMLAAAYRQYLKSGGTHRIEGFLAPSRAPHKRPGFELDFLAYDGALERYEALFGRDRVHVFAYERLARDPGNLLRAVHDELGLDFEPADVSTATVNPSFRMRTLALLRFLNHFHDREIPNASCWLKIPGMYPALRFAAPRIDRLPIMGRVPQLEDWLPPERIDAICDRYRESNARIEAQRGLGLAELGYPLPVE
jgi:hypothetical protein